MPSQQRAMPASVLSPKSPKSGTARRARHDLAPASPGYFGLTVDGSSPTVTSSGARMVKGSSSNVSIRSAAASPPQSLPFHSTPEYDAFRNAAERGSFDLHHGTVPKPAGPSEQAKGTSSLDQNPPSKQEPSTPRTKSASLSSPRAEEFGSLDLSAASRSPNKRLLSSDPSTILDRPRRESPAPFTEAGDARATGSPPSKHEEKYPRLAGSSNGKPIIPSLQNHGADTLPEKFDAEGPQMVTPQYVVNILDSHIEESLLLDLRVSTQYVRSRVSGALNLCVPTTLLKRPTYNVSRLADTFRDGAQRSKFEQWRSCKCIILYDGNSSQMKEAANCVNILKKFTSEGWNGDSYIIRGGFFEFSRKFPQHLDQGEMSDKTSSVPNLTLKTDPDIVAPVIGGCPMPASVTKSAANPFFGNIRQNMDLIGGVGQMKIKLPPAADKAQQSKFPLWLRKAADESDNGKGVSDKFFDIEKREQKRMQEALSGNVVYNASSGASVDKVQIAGIEKGAKNRYNNIWPFEHSRVKLEGVPNHGCDYVNANFVQSSLSNKKFIATQGPIPATFNDFWNMVWQRDVRVIVMLTAESEGGQVKAHNYWNGKSYGPFRLHYLSEHRASLELSKIRSHRERPSLGKHRSSHQSSTTSSSLGSRHTSHASEQDGPEKSVKSPSSSTEQPYVVVRKFTLSHEGEPFERMREITHLQYSSWPDFGAPAHPAHLLGLVEQCDAVVRADTSTTRKDAAPFGQRPVLVHCSAGCGRTGTFCTVDSVIDVLKKQKNYERNKRRALEQQRQRINDTRSVPMDLDTVTSSVSSKGTIPAAGMEGNWLERDDIDFIDKTVEEFRSQRLSMVQSLRQFVLCYETVLEWLMEQESPSSS